MYMCSVCSHMCSVCSHMCSVCSHMCPVCTSGLGIATSVVIMYAVCTCARCVTVHQVQEKLRVLFRGYAEAPPVCFVLCGNFTSQPYGPNHITTLKGMVCLRAKGEILR